jgi:hypothetical protein
MIIFGNALPALLCLRLSIGPLTSERTPQRYHHEGMGGSMASRGGCTEQAWSR